MRMPMPMSSATATATAALGLFPHVPKTPSQHHPKCSPSSTPSSLNLKPLHLTPANAPFQSICVSVPALTAATLPLLLNPPDALAVGGEFGILEGRSFALLHPVAMGGLFLYTLWAGYLGWQWRRIRTIQEEINDLKKDLKPSVQPKVAVSAEGPPVPPPSPSPPSPVEAKIGQLTEERKLLLKGNYRDRHFNSGSILLGFGVLEAVGGCLNTWFRTGKLFPGPHLFAGAAITVLWASAAALVPAMQKGNETARSLHIALNTINVLLFIWQIPTGFDIVYKVLEFTTWP